MDTKKFLTGTLVGGITSFVLGFVFYAILFGGFFEANGGTATGVMKTEMAWWPLILGNFAYAGLFCYIFLKWANISTFATGLRAGAAIGFFMAVAFDLIMYDTTNIMNLNAVLMDIAISIIMAGITGGVIGLVLRAKPEPTPSAA